MAAYNSIKKILIVVIIEVIVAIYLLLRCFINMADIKLGGDAFYDNIREKTNVEYTENLGVVFVSEKGTHSVEAYTYEMPLRCGGYEVTVDYEVEGIEKGNFDNVYYPETEHTVVGEVSLVSIHTSAIDMSGVKLTEGRNIASGRGYIRFGKTVPDVQLRIDYSNLGKLTVKNIHIKQSRSYQFVILFSFLIVSVLLDLLILLFFKVLEGGGIQILSKYKHILFIAGLAVILSASAFNKYLISGYDLHYHLMRIAHIAKELSYGQFPVRIYRDALNGYGYPSPLFYCDLFLYIPAVLYRMFLPLRTSYNIYVALVNLATVITAYYSCRMICKDDKISAVSTIMYCMCEWRINHVIRCGAVGGYTAFIFFPLIVAGIYRIYTEEAPGKKDRLCLAGGIAGLISCHTLSMDITVIFLIIFAFLDWKKTFTKKILGSLCISAIEAFMFSLYYIVPFIMSYIKYPLKAKMGESYIQERGIDLMQFLQLFYAGEDTHALTGQVAFAFGAGMMTALILIIYCLFVSNKKEEKEFRHCLGIILIITVISVLMMSRYFPSDMIYDNMPSAFLPVYFLLSSIQFPIRYMSITMSVLMLGTCVGLKYLKCNKINVYRVFVWFLGISSIIVYTVYIGYINTHSVIEDFTASDINLEQGIEGGEYLPGFESWKMTWDPAIIADDGVTVSNTERQNGDLLFDIFCRTNDSTNVTLPIFNYDNYYVKDSENVYFPTETDDEFRLKVLIPAGYSGRIRVYYKEPFYWRICEIITILSVFMVVFWGIRDMKGNKTKNNTMNLIQ